MKGCAYYKLIVEKGDVTQAFKVPMRLIQKPWTLFIEGTLALIVEKGDVTQAFKVYL